MFALQPIHSSLFIYKHFFAESTMIVVTRIEQIVQSNRAELPAGCLPLLYIYRPCAADVRRLNFPDIYRIMSGKSKKSALGITSRQYIVQFQLGTTRLLRFIDILLAVERTQQIIDSTTVYCIIDIRIGNARWVWLNCNWVAIASF